MTIVLGDAEALTTFPTVSLPSATPAGKLAWDSTRLSVVVSNGTTWIPVGSSSKAFSFLMGE